jgi:PKD repeat protein
MRTTTRLFMVAAAALALLPGCVKSVDVPAFAGPSTFAHAILLQVDRSVLTQNGVDFTDIRVTSTGPNGQSENIPLRAQVFVDGVAQDFGTLSTKTPITPATVRYTAPPSPSLAAGQTTSTVTISFTPTISGDFRSETSREVDIQLVPQGVILPTNPNLAASFSITPAAPQAFQTAQFDASTTTNNGAPCGLACTYSWNFGDGTTATGITTTHAFRTVAVFAVTLTVTDARGAQATRTQSVTVGTPTPPTASFTMSPTPAPVNVDVFFNASASRAVGPGRAIVSYSWNFGDGSTGSGVTVTHRYQGVGTYIVTLTVTDDAQASTQATQTLVVGSAGSNANAALTATPASPKVGARVSFDASASTPSTGATILTYKFDYGDGSPQETTTNPVQSHIYTGAGTFVASVEITDSNGKTSTRTLAVIVQP